MSWSRDRTEMREAQGYNREDELVDAIDQQRKPKVLDGWKEIHAFLEELSGVERTRMTLWRWSKRRIDPLPIWRRIDHVFADPVEVKAWWERHRLTY